MGKLRVLSGREVCQILEGQGFSAVRQRGSHIVMQQRSGSATTTVPVPDADQALVAHEPPAAAGENWGPAGEALQILLAPAASCWPKGNLTQRLFGDMLRRIWAVPAV